MKGLTVTNEIEVKREAWLAERRQHVTATDLPKLLGLSRWGGPTGVYLDKIDAAEVTENEAMQWGRRLEEPILRAAAERLGVPMELADPHRLVVCPDEPILACSLDAQIIVAEGALGPPVDAKNIRNLDLGKWGDEGTDQIPDEYAVQLSVQMACTGAREAFLAVLFFGQHMRIYRVERDEEIVATAKEAAVHFWHRYVEPRVQPPPDGSLAYSEALSKRLRQTTDLVLDADEDTKAWAQVLREARAQAGEIEKVIEEAQQNLKERIGSSLGVQGPGFRITWKTTKPNPKVDFQAAADALVTRLVNRGVPLDLVAAAWAESVKEATHTPPGVRRFLPTFMDEINKAD